jgi:hypothetical protein
MIKLTISHAIAQSTKLCFFEERMGETMSDAQHVPKTLALTGELNMTRTEIVKILGRLFKSRVDINLCTFRFSPWSLASDFIVLTTTTASNILDVPNFFWDSEPTLHPLYAAIREYLEIDPRIKVLNERCRVFLDLAEILSDSVADSKMSAITWIIIILIIVSILVTVTEVTLRFAMLEKSKNDEKKWRDGHPADVAVAAVKWSHKKSSDDDAVVFAPPPSPVVPGQQLSDLEILARELGLMQDASLEDVRQGIWNLKQVESDRTGSGCSSELR